MTTLTYRPRPAWTDPETRDRKRYPFMRPKPGGGWGRDHMPLRDSEQLLEREARELGAKTAVIEVIAPDRAFRLDGLMRADARIDHPGVVVTLDTRHGPVRMATDAMHRWQDNVRAIALSLEALRKVDRYGVTKRGEQYTGWKQLGGGVAIVPEQKMTVDEAARILAEHTGQGVIASYRDLLGDLGGGGARRAEYITTAWRSAVKLHHPDAGGDRANWDRLEQAKRVLDQHTGGMS
jgi:hypothetical protein